MTPLDQAKERLRQAKDISLIGLIKELGYKLDSDGSYYSMLSPFRSEGQGSLKINKSTTDKWRDYGNGKHGDVIDFVRELFSLSVNEAVDYLLKKSIISLPEYAPVKQDVKAIEIKAVEPLSDPGLIDYITGRKIGLNQAKTYLKQARICFPNGKNPQREYLVIAWANNSGGYEFRNGFFKIGNAPKDVTNIEGRFANTEYLNEVFLFEGWPDFLSYLTYFNCVEMRGNAIILNSISFLEVIIPFIKDKEVVYYGQNDTASNKAYTRLTETCNYVIDRREIYLGYKDFNDFLCGKPIKKKIKSISEMLNN